MSNFKKYLLTTIGFLFVGLGLVGIIIPVLPTTPFLLLAVIVFSKSSETVYQWLLTNRWFGSYISNYREGKGIPLLVKISSITFLWISILTSAIFFIDNVYIKILLIVIAIGVTIHISSLKTMRK